MLTGLNDFGPGDILSMKVHTYDWALIMILKYFRQKMAKNSVFNSKHC
jgi:hypothetical protein